MKNEKIIEELSKKFNNLIIYCQNLDQRLNKIESKRIVFKPPTIDELSDYMKMVADSIGIIEYNHKEEASNMFDYYEGINWESKRSKIKKWKPVARNWVKRYKQFRKDTPSGSPKLGFKNQANLEAMGG